MLPACIVLEHKKCQHCVLFGQCSVCMFCFYTKCNLRAWPTTENMTLQVLQLTDIHAGALLIDIIMHKFMPFILAGG